MNKSPQETDAFIRKNLGLVHSCANRFRGRGIEYDDLYGAGCMGLVKAVAGFDESRGLCFSTYAVPVILGEIRRLFRDGGAVKVSKMCIRDRYHSPTCTLPVRDAAEMPYRCLRNRSDIVSGTRSPHPQKAKQALCLSGE